MAEKSSTATTRSVVRIDMIHGGMIRKILMFSLPLIASGILQQSFNAIDVAVVGRFSSSRALAAVGSNGVIISILINLFIGISIGANVVIANYIGRNNHNGIRKSVATVGAVALISGIFLMLIGLCITRPILEWMDTPPDVIDLAALYLRIIFLGMPFMMIYNFGSAIMRSMGDTKRPFYALIVGGTVNTLLNLLLVIRFGMSVEGVAIATVVANVINAAFIIYWLRREPAPYRLELRRISISRNELGKMLRIGVPAGVQGMVFSLANLFIQSAINSYGSDAIAGSAAALNYEVYCYFIISAFVQAAVAFISQNYGAGNYDRCRRAFRCCMIFSLVSCALANILIVWQHSFFLGLFSTDPQVMHYGMIRLHCVLMFQFIASSYEISGGALRGLGYSMTPTILTVFGTCVLRLIWVYTINAHYHKFDILMWIYPISWAITGLMVGTAYYVVSRKVFRHCTHSI